MKCWWTNLQYGSTSWPKSGPRKTLRGPKILPRSWLLLVSSIDSNLLTEADSEDQQQNASDTAPSGKTYGDLEGSSSSNRAVVPNRVISGASTLEEGINSTGGAKILVSKEATTGNFCSNLFMHLCSSVWPKGRILLDWVQGRDGTCLNWAATYFPQSLLWLSLRLTSLWKMGDHRVEAQTDGALFIGVPDPLAQTTRKKNLVWPRSYYVLPLEVVSPPLFLFVCMRFFHRRRDPAHRRPNARFGKQGKTALQRNLKSRILKAQGLPPRSLPKCSEWPTIPNTLNMKIKRHYLLSADFLILV
jgi:hypothetical protein